MNDSRPHDLGKILREHFPESFPPQNTAPRSKKRKSKSQPPLSLRLSFDERVRLKKDAGSMTMSAYIRSRLFGDDVSPRRMQNKEPVKDQKALSRLLGEIAKSRMANNLNQIAKAANMGALPVSEEVEADIQEACSHIRDMRRMLVSALGLKSGDRA